jgi:hypothetical protein
VGDLGGEFAQDQAQVAPLDEGAEQVDQLDGIGLARPVLMWRQIPEDSLRMH